jgi:peptidoglycan/xylan/chitin deacetylase (PgdA/CDA1 family)
MLSLTLAAVASALVGHVSAGTIQLAERQVSTNGRCGNGFGTTCQPGYCCSVAGYCGQGYLYCSAPSCQIDYGPACDANVRPNGPNTVNTPRPQLGNVEYGDGLYHCTEYGDIALTYDDGPYEYTKDLLDMLLSYNAKATFFITGRNLGKGAINDPSTPWPALIRRMIAEGHQVAGHTWSHQRLTTLSREKFNNQIYYLETALADILGYFPTYMRPPYSASNATTDAWLGQMGYHVTYFSLDTEGYLNDDPNRIQASKDIWDANVEGRNPAQNRWLAIEHDPVYQSVYNLTGYMLNSLFKNNFRSVTVGQCLQDPQANWYRRPSGDTSFPGSSTSGASTPASTATGVPPGLVGTTDGRCGPQFGETCASERVARCCSRYSWCGSSDLHCYDGCQFGFGDCKSGVPPSMSSLSANVRSSTTSATSRTSTSTTARPASTGGPTKDGRCGPNFSNTNCFTEPGATCCSKYGWCGANSDYCGTGCQPLFGTCS